MKSHLTHVNESCQTYEWVMSHIWMSQVTHMNEPWHIWTSHVNEPWHAWTNHCKYDWVMAYVVVTISRLPKNICLFCKRALLKRLCMGWAILRSRRPCVSWIFAPKTFCLTNQLFGLCATNSFGLGAPSFQDHKVPQSLWKVPFDLEAPRGCI